VAQLAFDTQSRYAQLLQELGFVDEQGRFIPGLLETEALRRRAELSRGRELALQDVIEGAVRGGTVFSGRRAKLTAQAQEPYDAAIAQIGTVLGRELSARYGQLSDLTRQFELTRNMLIAEAAERIAERLRGMPVGDSEGAVPGERAAPAAAEYMQKIAQIRTTPAGMTPAQFFRTLWWARRGRRRGGAGGRPQAAE
jgi:hypothetical protein